MNTVLARSIAFAISAGLAASVMAGPFNSGSTGADGAFAPTANVTVQLPQSGILNYTTVNIPAGVTVKFAKNSANTAAVILAAGDVTVAGTIDVSGGASMTTRSGYVGEQNRGGVGGPGGFDGGRGGNSEANTRGGTGYGLGGGGGGLQSSAVCYNMVQGGGGGGFGGYGDPSQCVRNNGSANDNAPGYGGPVYGSNAMLPLLGGSGGGGGGGGPNSWSLPGSGGGGGGGALMIVASGSVVLSGSINAQGGAAGSVNNGNCDQNNRDFGGAGGGGAGGAVRILTPSFSGSGAINTGGGIGGCRAGVSSPNGYNAGGNGAGGRSSIETVTGGSFNPSVLPSLAISSIGGVAVPPNPSGVGDVTLPGDMPNPVAVTVTAAGIPVGTVVKLTLNIPYGGPTTVNTSALAGTLQASTATGNVAIPTGASVLMAWTSYTLTLAMGEALKMYAGGERVERVALEAALGSELKVTLVTVSGKEFVVPASVLALIPAA